jgi:adenylosuccinate synthase
MNLVVIGAQWGDEGKGKIVDFLAEKAGIVLRFSGGANAGHTIVKDGQTFKLHLVPSGIIYPGKTVILGIGMVIDPVALFEELGSIERSGISWQGRVLVSDRAHLVLPRYRDADRDKDKARITPIGTTGRGIGVAYSLKAERDGIRVADLYDARIWSRLPQADRSFLEPVRDRLSPMVVDTSLFLAGRKGEDVLYEGAQGTLLDLDMGTYPYVSSGMSAASGAPVGGGCGPHAIDSVIGVCKAYSTRVGNGPFPSEYVGDRNGSLGDALRDIGREYGVTTGRPRRCGALDLVALRYACRSNSIDSLAITKMDIYDGFDEILVCDAYECAGKRVTEFPARLDMLEGAVPVTATVRGWKEPLGSVRSFDALPRRAKDYLRLIEKSTGVPVSIISVGSGREETIVRKDPWTRS